MSDADLVHRIAALGKAASDDAKAAQQQSQRLQAELLDSTRSLQAAVQDLRADERAIAAITAVAQRGRAPASSQTATAAGAGLRKLAHTVPHTSLALSPHVASPPAGSSGHLATVEHSLRALEALAAGRAWRGSEPDDAGRLGSAAGFASAQLASPIAAMPPPPGSAGSSGSAGSAFAPSLRLPGGAAAGSSGAPTSRGRESAATVGLQEHTAVAASLLRSLTSPSPPPALSMVEPKLGERLRQLERAYLAPTSASGRRQRAPAPSEARLRAELRQAQASLEARKGALATYVARQQELAAGAVRTLQEASAARFEALQAQVTEMLLGELQTRMAAARSAGADKAGAALARAAVEAVAQASLWLEQTEAATSTAADAALQTAEADFRAATEALLQDVAAAGEKDKAAALSAQEEELRGQREAAVAAALRSLQEEARAEMGRRAQEERSRLAVALEREKDAAALRLQREHELELDRALRALRQQHDAALAEAEATHRRRLQEAAEAAEHELVREHEGRVEERKKALDAEVQGEYQTRLRELEEACTAAAQVALQRHREALQADVEARVQEARLATTVAEEQALQEEAARCEDEMQARIAEVQDTAAEDRAAAVGALQRQLREVHASQLEELARLAEEETQAALEAAREREAVAHAEELAAAADRAAQRSRLLLQEERERVAGELRNAEAAAMRQAEAAVQAEASEFAGVLRRAQQVMSAIASGDTEAARRVAGFDMPAGRSGAEETDNISAIELGQHLREAEALQSTGSRLQHALKDMSAALFSPSTGRTARDRTRVGVGRGDAGTGEETTSAATEAEVAAFSPRRLSTADSARGSTAPRALALGTAGKSLPQARSRSGSRARSGGLAGALLRSMHDSSDEEGGSLSESESPTAGRRKETARGGAMRHKHAPAADLPIADLLGALQTYLATLQSHHAGAMGRLEAERKQCLRLARALAELQTARGRDTEEPPARRERASSRISGNTVRFGATAAPTTATFRPADASLTAAAEVQVAAERERRGLHPAVTAVDASFGSWPSARPTELYSGAPRLNATLSTGGTGLVAGPPPATLRGASSTLQLAPGGAGLRESPPSMRGTLLSPNAVPATQSTGSAGVPSAASLGRRGSLTSQAGLQSVARPGVVDKSADSMRARHASDAGPVAAPRSNAFLHTDRAESGEDSGSRVHRYISAVLQQWGLEGDVSAPRQIPAAGTTAPGKHERASFTSEVPSSVTHAASDAGSVSAQRFSDARNDVLQQRSTRGSISSIALGRDTVSDGARASMHASSRSHVVIGAAQAAAHKKSRSPPGPGSSRGVALLGRRQHGI